MKSITSRDVVFITGAFVHHSCWDEWKSYFESRGFNAIAPPWPYKDAPPQELRSRHPEIKELATLTLGQVIDHYAGIIRKFPKKPIVIGHSTGGLITQVLVNRDLADAGVAIHSAPTLGVFPYEPTFLIGGWKSLGLGTSTKKTYLMSFKDFQYAFVNGMPYEEQKAAWEKLTIPESKTAVRGALTKAAKVDYNKPHAPLLLTAGSTDTLIPAHLNRRNYDKYHKNGSDLDYKEFPGRNHYVLGQRTWKGDADYILEWIGGHSSN